MTLNAGFSTGRDENLTQAEKEEREMVEKFIQEKGITQLQPAGAPGNEATRSTNERIAKARREFRKNNQLKAQNK